MNVARSPLSAPHVYFAVTKNLLYIGQTQQHPVLRWGAHLLRDGSLRKALARRGDPQVDYLSDLLFVGFRCSQIESKYPPLQHQTVTQAVEHEAHCVLAEHSTGFTVISDTTRTAPSRFSGWPAARTIAEECVNKFFDALRGRMPGNDWAIVFGTSPGFEGLLPPLEAPVARMSPEVMPYRPAKGASLPPPGGI